MIRKGYSFDDVLLVPRYNDIVSRKDVDIGVQFGGLRLGIPVLSANMDTVTGNLMARTMYNLGGLGVLHRFCSIDDNIKMYKDVPLGKVEFTAQQDSVISLGVNENLDRFAALYEVGARYFCVDVAHGHTKAVGKFVKRLKQTRGGVFIIAGNVATHAGADYLASCGADAIKVGIGPGSVCTTRIKTGCGVPQLTAIMDCSKVDRLIIADGGIKNPGDAVKALAAGAHAVMLGGMLAGCNETPGEIIEDYSNVPHYNTGELFSKEQLSAIKKYKLFRGMASKEAQDDFFGSQSEWKTAEGIEIRVKAKGPVANVVSDLTGGIRSAMTYMGAKNLEALRRNAEFIEVTANGVSENKPHGEGRL